MTFQPEVDAVRLCAIVPTRNHVRWLPDLILGLKGVGVPLFLVDDGSDDIARQAIAALGDPEAAVSVIRLSRNEGKGRAVIAGFRAAQAAGFTHALQIDADGQHDLGDLPQFVALANADPGQSIFGRPTYDESAPALRKHARKFTQMWVYIETCSRSITDSMCGYRLYPLKSVMPIVEREYIGSRMDFDTEIAVHLSWRGERIVMLPTRVIYPAGNLSNFRMIRDNIRISLMHTRLVLQAPFRLLMKAARAWT